MIKKTDKSKASTNTPDQMIGDHASAAFRSEDSETERLRFFLRKAVNSETAPEELRLRISQMIRRV